MMWSAHRRSAERRTGASRSSAWSKNTVKPDTLSGVTNFVVHNLRRTAGTNLVRLTVLPHIRERVRNHVIAGVEDVYNRHSRFNEKREALNVYDTFLWNLLSS